MADGDLALIGSASPVTGTGSVAAPPSSRTLNFREDFWSEDATSTLVDAWGRRYLELNRGNLRRKDWQDVADAVNVRHGNTKKTRRSDVQCKNRIDTLKKKYKAEKARVSELQITSSWPFYSRLDTLIGTSATARKSSSSSKPYRKPPSTVLSSQPQPVAILRAKRPLPQPLAVDDSYFRRNYSAVAAAAAAAAEDDGSEDDESLGTSEDDCGGGRGGSLNGMKLLARSIERFAEIYERVEGEKQKQMIELEKQRMQFTKDLEVQRMQLFMDTQVQLKKIKQSDDDIYS